MYTYYYFNIGINLISKTAPKELKDLCNFLFEEDFDIIDQDCVDEFKVEFPSTNYSLMVDLLEWAKNNNSVSLEKFTNDAEETAALITEDKIDHGDTFEPWVWDDKDLLSMSQEVSKFIQSCRATMPDTLFKFLLKNRLIGLINNTLSS